MKIFIHENAYENVGCEMAAILFRVTSYGLSVMSGEMAARYHGGSQYVAFIFLFFSSTEASQAKEHPIFWPHGRAMGYLDESSEKNDL